MADVGQCPFGPGPHSRGNRHTHDYEPPPSAPRQCTCGSRGWLVSVFPLLPPKVICARCRRANRVATAYEEGRAKGPRVRNDENTAAPF